jgi:Concanavalin A-like lectin/glucanases superfamily
MRRPIAAILTLLLLGVAAAIAAFEPWKGPVVLSLSAGHGIHAADLLAVPFVVLAIAVWRGQGRAVPSGSRAAAAPALVLGVLLLLAGVGAKAGGGPLRPVGGGTIDGTIQEAAATDPVPVDRWSAVAVTYDGATERLYVNGDEVTSRASSGAIQVTPDPLWIGGNQPYGEHFRGVIDEVRVYSRALGAREIRADMARPVAPARGLVAGYGFDAGSGTTARDASGEGNAGEIEGAAWTRGRYGHALSFDGTDAVVRVPTSASLDLTRAVTLSGWIRPTDPQSGWRTVVQHQADAYLLTAGSDRQNRFGAFDDLRAAVIVAALVWFCVVIATGRAPSSPERRRSWWQPVALFLAGSLVDAVLAPTGSLVGPTLVALWLAGTAERRAEAVAFLLAAAGFAGLTIVWLADGATPRDDGSIARMAALGVLFVLGGAASALVRRRAA